MGWSGSRTSQLTEEETRRAFELLVNLQFRPTHGCQGSPEQRARWPFGISGDLPIAALRVEEERMEAALSLERIHQFLVYRADSCSIWYS